MGDYAEAEPLFRRSLEIREKRSGADHPDYATSLNNLAGLYQDHGRVRQGRAALPPSPGDREKRSGGTTPTTPPA